MTPLWHDSALQPLSVGNKLPARFQREDIARLSSSVSSGFHSAPNLNGLAREALLSSRSYRRLLSQRTTARHPLKMLWTAIFALI